MMSCVKKDKEKLHLVIPSLLVLSLFNVGAISSELL
jgi:hypothetical protein